MKLRILLLDDNANDRFTFARELRRIGEVEIIEAQDEQSFLAELGKGAPDAAVIDASFPRYSGMDALNAIREHYPDCPVILLTGSLQDEQAAEWVDRGFDRALQKDRPAQLRSAVKRECERRLLERERREREQRDKEILQAHERNAALGELLSGVAHDFNNDLHLIGAGASMLLDKKIGLLDEKTILERMIAASNHAAEMVKQLLNQARGINGGEMKPLTPDEVLKGLVVLVSSFPKSIRVETQIAAGTARMMCGKTQLQRAILNLCLNARDAMPKGGRLTISACNSAIQSTDPKMRGKYVCISVADTGQGIPDDAIERIWETFFTTKEKGHGIGLSQVRNIIQNHQGWIDVASSSNGTTFNVYIPAEKEKPEEKRRFDGGGRTILFVDDLESMLKIIPAQLESANYKVIPALNAFEALGHFREGAKIDLLIADYVMPLMSGAELITNLRANKINVPAIIVTGVDTDKIDDVDAPILKKPYTQEQLLDACEKALQ